MTKRGNDKGLMTFACPIESLAARANVRVSLNWDCREGVTGEYEPDDDRDIPLMRFDVQAYEPGHGEAGKDGWFTLPDASCCTNIDARLDKAEHERLVKHLLDAVADEVDAGNSIKKLCEHLSWIDDTWGRD